MAHQDIIKMLEQEWQDRLEAAVKQEQEKFSADLIEYGKGMAAVEREACAVIADSMDACQDGEIGKAIRARGEAQ